MTKTRILILVCLGSAAAFIYGGGGPLAIMKDLDGTYAQTVQTAMSGSNWDYYAILRLNKDAQAIFSKGVLTLKYDEPILTMSLGEMSFNLKTWTLVPEVFEGNTSVNEVTIEQTTTCKDKRGNDRKCPLFRETFRRSTAASIHWGKINFADIPSLADRYWSAGGQG